uniref:NADH-ubiquinone oxidoreductase chain 3 n=1 Tax=Ptilodactylidae sp. 3 ACP-2013 TaxID=1434564 RepID=A0A3G3FX25_9COLE|nr:NADH dehydrogenase subunit 3 [Ptilodactylidae sp. 3 ACP-2013]
MLSMTMTAIFIIMISIIIMFAASIMSKKTFKDREKSSPFECGFDPFSTSRLPFSLQFFLITIVFLIFDIEIALLMPMILTLKLSNLWNFVLSLITFIIIMLWGLYHEWNQGALEWSK